MKLLRVIATLDPRHGGPSAGLRAITPALAARGHETTFVSIDSPERAASFVSGSRAIGLGPAQGGYAYSPRLEPWLRAHAAEFDAVFVHGLWQHPGRAVHAALGHRAPPYFVFPHGMLDPWFRRAYPLKHAKKWAYWHLCERRVLSDAAAVFFTCAEERRLAQRTFPRFECNAHVVAYGTNVPAADAAAAQRAAWAAMVPELSSRPFWLFLGRIHPKKGVDLLVRAYRQLALEATSTLPALVIAGPSQDAEYLAAVREQTRELPASGLVLWPGMLEGAAKWGALRTAEAFVLPSHQENFGIAAAESLAVGTPVLLTRKVNIWTEIVEARAGLEAKDDFAGIFQLLQRWSGTTSEERLTMRAAAVKLFRDRYEIGRVAESLIAAVTPFVHERPAPFHEVDHPNHAPDRVR